MFIKYTKTLTINMIIFFSLIIFLELLVMCFRYLSNRAFVGFLIDNRKTTIEKKSSLGDDCLRMRTHPFYTVTHDHRGNCKILDGEINGPLIYYNFNKNFSNLVTLGGSTTDGFYKKYGQVWPSHLSDKIIKKNITLNVINGGNGDFGSSQELQKLLIDIGNLKNVKYVISLSGINDLQGRNKYLRFQNKYPFWTNIQLEMFIYKKWIDQSVNSSRYLPNILSLISTIKRRLIENSKQADISWKKSLDFKNNKNRNSIQDWYYNVKMMNSISQTMGAEFFLFLQPTMGISKAQTPTDKSSKHYKTYQKLDDAYYKRIKNHYKDLKILCSQLKFCYDISDIANTDEDELYYDPRHHNEKGNKIIADEIFNVIFQR